MLFCAAAHADCYVVIVGGITMHENDIHDSIWKHTVSEAQKTKCKVLGIPSNTPYSEFQKRFKDFTKELAPKDSVHIAFSDHGAPVNDENKPLEGVIPFQVITDKSGHEFSNGPTYREFAETLKSSLPKQVHLTFVSNTCWPKYNLMQRELLKGFNTCGAASTHEKELSYNVEGATLTEVGFRPNSKRHAPSIWSMYRVAFDITTRGDFTNEGDLSSTAYARSVLTTKKIPQRETNLEQLSTLLHEMDHVPKEELLRDNRLNESSRVEQLQCKTDEWETLPGGKLTVATQLECDRIAHFSTRGIEGFQKLPAEWQKEAQMSLKWIRAHSPELEYKIALWKQMEKKYAAKTNLLERDPSPDELFGLTDDDSPEKLPQKELKKYRAYAAIHNGNWGKMSREMMDERRQAQAGLAPFVAQYRRLEIAETLAKFYAQASKAQVNEYEKIFACEHQEIR